MPSPWPLSGSLSAPTPTLLLTVIHPAHVGELLRWGLQERLRRVLSPAPRLWQFIEKEQMVTVLLSYTTSCFLLPVTFTQEEAKHTCQVSSFAAKNMWSTEQEGSHCHQVSRSHWNFSHWALGCSTSGRDTILLWKWVARIIYLDEFELVWMTAKTLSMW